MNQTLFVEGSTSTKIGSEGDTPVGNCVRVPEVELRDQTLGEFGSWSVNQIRPFTSIASVAGIALEPTEYSCVTTPLDESNSPILPAPYSVNQNVWLSAPVIMALGTEFVVLMG